jgi:thiosulfate/3-mercaptopyruvate sulfurtransferase
LKGERAMGRSIDPIVSTEWLAAHLGPDLTVIDIRDAEAYQVGHIPGAVSVPFGPVSAWADCTEELLIELPPVDGLFQTIGDCGLSAQSQVVVAGRLPQPPDPPYPLADPLRVAATLMYAGVGAVAVLSGGHARWEAEGRTLSTDAPRVEARPYNSAVDAATWVSTEYVKDRIGRAILVDGRDPDQYFGASIDPFADMRGHIPTARCLPLKWVWEPDGTYRPIGDITDMARGVVGPDQAREIICYCGVGGYGSGWWFLLTQLMGYADVKIYDGSMEAWVDGQNPLVRNTWVE